MLTLIQQSIRSRARAWHLRSSLTIAGADMSITIDLNEAADTIESELDTLAVVRDALQDLEYTIQYSLDNVSAAEDELQTALSCLQAAADELSKNV